MSIILSEQAKAIVNKFEEQIADRSENDKDEMRIDLLMLLVRRLHPEVLSANAKGPFAELYRMNNSTTDKNLGFLMSCLEENELDFLGNNFKSIWSYYRSMLCIEGIAKSNDYEKLLLCDSLMPNKKRKLVLNYSLITLDMDSIKSLFKEDRGQDTEFDARLAELEIAVSTFSGLTFDRIVVPNLSSISNSNLDSFVKFIEEFVKADGTIFVSGSPTEINWPDYQQFRKWVVDNKFLHRVIEMEDLPSYDAKGQILVLRRQSTNSIFFAWVDGFENDIEKIARVIAEKNPNYCKEVSVEEFKAHNSEYFTFIARQYVPLVTANEGETIVTLGDLVDLYDSEIEEDIPCFFLNRSFYLDFYNVDNNPIEAVVIPRARRVPQGNFFLLKLDDDDEQFLCSYIGEDSFDLEEHASIGIDYNKIYDADRNPMICTYPNAIIFKLKETPKVPIDTSYLLSLLSTLYPYYYYNDSRRLAMFRMVQKQLECYRLPYSDISIENEDFLSIKLAVPSIEEQQRLVNLDRQKALANTREEIKKKFESYKQDIRMKKHALAQTLRVMKGWWTNLQMARENGNGVIDDTATIGQLHPVVVKDIFGNIDHEMNMLFKQVNSFNMGDTMKVDVCDAKDFIQQYVNHHDPMFEYQCELPEKATNIRFPKEAFQIILDNISSNACSHGFKGREKEKNIIRIIAEIKGQDLIIRVDNNGKPMPVGMTAEKVFTYGDTTEEGLDEHGGLGGYQIKDLMTKFGGEVELDLNSEADFPVAYKLVFRDVNIYK